MACATTSTSFHSLSSTSYTNQISPRGSRPHSAASFGRRRSIPSISAVYATADAKTSNNHHLAVAKTSSFYELLGVQDCATCKEIKAAYRRLARALHPDVAATSSADEFIRVNEAYSTLSDPAKRADYDKMLLFKRRRSGYSPNYCYSSASGGSGNNNKYGTTSCSGFSGYTRRTWETDQCW